MQNLKSIFLTICLVSFLSITESKAQSNLELSDWLAKAQLSLLKGDLDQALAESEEGIHQDSSNYQAWYLHGIVQKQKMKRKEAVSSLQRADALQPGDKQIHSQLSTLYFELQKYTSSIDYADSVLLIDSLHYKSMINKGLSLVKLQKLDQAYLLFNKMHARDSSDVFALKQMGGIKTKQDSLQQAIHLYHLVTKVDSMDIQAYGHLGNLYVKSQKYEEGIPVLSEILERDTTQAFLYRFRGSLHLMGADFKAAEDDFKSSIQCGDSTSFNYRHLGLALFKQSMYAEALKVYQKTIKIDPEDAQAWFYLAYCHKWNDDLDAAILHMDKALELSVTPTISEVYVGLAKFHGYQRGYDKAMHYYSRAYEWDPENAVPLAQMGMLVEQTGGKKEHAKTYYKNFMLKADPMKDGALMQYVNSRLSVINEKMFMEGTLERVSQEAKTKN